ncbi:MAG: AMP-binding protein [Steroidobacteraceae bacterium]
MSERTRKQSTDRSPTEVFLEARDFLLRHREDYETAYRDFRWPQLEHFNWALDVFDVLAQGNDAPALWVAEEDGREAKLTYAQMAARSSQVANFFGAVGVKRGDRVLLMLPNCVPLWEAMLAAIKLGAVIVPTSLLVTAEELADRVQRGRIRHVIAAAAEASKFATISAEVTRIGVGAAEEGWHRFEDAYRLSTEFVPGGITHANDPQILYFTSGTTAKPKLVLHSQQSYPLGHLSTMYWIGLKPGDVHWNISSPGWAKHAWSCVFAPWNAGATAFVYDYGRFHGKAVLEILRRCKVTTLCAPPTVWRMLIQEDLKSYPVELRELVGAGEPLNPEVIERVRAAWGITIRDGFGQTETTCLIGNSPRQSVKPGSMGRPMPGYEVVLLDGEGRPVTEGEVALTLHPRPAGLMLRYEDDVPKTAEALRAGCYHTSDVARRDADGYYTYVGRTDDVFKASGYRISPFELESILIEHEAVAEAAVVPSPDPVRLAVPKAFVSLRAGYTPSRELAGSILQFCRQRMAPYQRARRIEFRELPKTISGKIRRVELRQMEQARNAQIRRRQEFWEEDFS